MAQIDASIPLGVKPFQMPDQMNALARVMQLKGLQQDSELGQMKADEYKRGVSESNALNQLYTSALKPDGTIDRSALFSGAAQRGLGSKIPGLQKTFAEQDKATLEADEKKFKLAKDRHDYFKTTVGALAQEPNLSKELVIQAGQSLVQQGILPKEMFEQSLANMPDDPIALRAKLTQALKSQMTPEQIFTVFAPKATQVDNGQQIGFRDTNPNSPTYGQATAGGAVQKVATPGDVLSATTSTANNQRSVAASYANANATREAASTNAQATRDAAAMRRDQDTEMKLADDWRNQSKPFKEVSDAYKIITASLDKATTSPAATLAGATKFMKLLDPGSVVRESELGMALAATGVLDRAANYYNTLSKGKVLTEKQAADFKDIAGQIYKAAQDGQKQVDANYQGQAKQYNLRPNMIVQDLGQNQSVPVNINSLPKAGASSAKPKVVDFGSLK